MENYIQLEVLSESCLGKVLLLQEKTTGMLYSGKVVDAAEENVGAINQELELLFSLRHRGIVEYRKSFFHPELGVLVLLAEYYPFGNLRKVIEEHRARRVRIQEECIRKWLVEICLALQYLHSHNLIHRDIRPENVVIDENGCAKISDYGSSRLLLHCGSERNNSKTLSAYQSPELCRGGQSGTGVDVWSLGCIIYELCSLSPAYRADDLVDLIMKTNKPTVYPRPISAKKYSRELVELVSGMLEKDQAQRLSIQDVMKSGYVNEYLSSIIFVKHPVSVEGPRAHPAKDHRYSVNRFTIKNCFLIAGLLIILHATVKHIKNGWNTAVDPCQRRSQSLQPEFLDQKDIDDLLQMPENELTAKAYFSIGLLSENIQDKLNYFNKSIVIYSKLGTLKEEAAQVFYNLGNAVEPAEEKQEYYLRALAIHDSLKVENEMTAMAYNNLGVVTDDVVAEKESYMKAHGIYRKLGMEEGVAQELINLGTSSLSNSEQQEYYLKAVALYQKLGIEGANLGLVFNNLGNTCEEAELRREYYGKAIRVYEGNKVVSEALALAYINQGLVSEMNGEKLRCFLSAVNIYDKLKLENGNLGNLYCLIAHMYKMGQDAEQMRGYAALASGVFRSVFGPDHDLINHTASLFNTP